MRHQIQTKPAGRRQPWIDVEVFDGTEAEAIVLIEARSAEDGRPWRFVESHEPAVAEQAAAVS